MDHATILASQGKLSEAVDVLSSFEATSRQLFDDNAAILLAALRLDLRRDVEAVRGANGYLTGRSTADSIGALAILFRNKSRSDLALNLIEPFGSIIDGSPALLELVIDLEQSAGHAGKAHARLERLEAEGYLPIALYTHYVDLAVEFGDVARVEQFVIRVGSDAISPDLIANLVGALLTAGEAIWAQAIVRRTGEAVLADRPMLGAELALALDDRPGAERWVRRAEIHPALPASERVALAGYWAGTGRTADARRLALILAQDPATPAEEMPSLAAVFAGIGATPSDVALFEEIKERKSALPLQAAWAIVASAAGKGTHVQEWLTGALPTISSPTLLTNLYLAARTGKLFPMALAVATRLHALEDSPRNTALFAGALTGAGRAVDALPLIRPLLPGTQTIRQVYLAALAKAYVAGAPVRDELVAFATKRLGDSSLAAAERDEIASTLVEAGAFDIALPMLATLAQARGGAWLYGYLDAAKKAKRNDEAIAFLRSELARTDLAWPQREERLYAFLDLAGSRAALSYLESFADSYGRDWVFSYEDALIKNGQEGRFLDYLAKRTERGDMSGTDRRDAGFRLLNAGRKAAAERIFLSLARDEGPEGPDVGQLLYLWGPRPNAAALDWLESRARAATGPARAGWLAHLVNVGANERVVRFAEALAAPAAMDDAIYFTYLEALAAMRRSDRLAAALRARLPTENEPNRLRDMGQLAADSGLASESLLAYQRLLTLKPDDRGALRAVGSAALSQRRYEEARQRLERYLGTGESDPEVRYAYAEAFTALGQRDRAATEYTRALKEIEAIAKPNFHLRLVRANILQRIGRAADAIASFEALKAERPNDPELRADLATALLQNKSYDRAKQVLSTP
jgi:tetratricopeptide (TPR) repeat protein